MATKYPDHLYGSYDFDRLKSGDLARRDREIAGVRAEIKVNEERWHAWKQTHRWDGNSHEWVEIGNDCRSQDAA